MTPETTNAEPQCPDSIALQLSGVGKEFLSTGGDTVRALDGIDLTVNQGEFVTIVGATGCGKTTLLNIIAGLDKADRGALRLGEEIQLGKSMGYVFQHYTLFPWRTALYNVEFGLQMRGAPRHERKDRACELLAKVGLSGFEKAYPHELSGGMRQRAAIAMALACEPKLLIADEPTTALDVTVQAQILDLLRQLQERFDMGMLFVTHNLGVVADICDRVAVMYAGQIVETADVEDLFAAPAHPYTEGLLRAMPQLGQPGERLSVIAGSPPVPWDLPGGCRFAPRCTYATPACSATLPQLEGAAGHRSRCPLHPTLSLQGASDA